MCEKEDRLSVSLSAANFPDNRELKSLQELQKSGGPVKFTASKDALVRLAQHELEAAIYWDTELGGKRIADLANRELDVLKRKRFKKQGGKHESEGRPSGRNPR